MTDTASTTATRALLARDGIFNLRDLGGMRTADGRAVAPRRIYRGDSLHRSAASSQTLRDLRVTRVLDLRDDRERDEDGVLVADGIEVRHHPVLDPAFAWHDDDHQDLDTLLAHRYRVILESFPERFVAAIGSIVEVVDAGPGAAAPDGVAPDAAVAYHCAVGKDRTGLLTALVLDVLDVPEATIVDDYRRSASATSVQVGWLWAMGHPAGDASEDDIEIGVWSARPETMVATLAWLRDEHGGAEQYLLAGGLDAEAVAGLRRAVLEPAPE